MLFVLQRFLKSGSSTAGRLPNGFGPVLYLPLSRVREMRLRAVLRALADASNIVSYRHIGTTQAVLGGVLYALRKDADETSQLLRTLLVGT